MARNGNGPVRVVDLRRTGIYRSQPLAEVEAAALAKARAGVPGLPGSGAGAAIFLEEVQLAVLGRKTPEEAVAAIVERVKPLMPA